MTGLPPVVLSIEVVSTVEHAFATFTEGIGQWWPVKGHSVGDERVTKVVLEPNQGGDLYEEWDDGTRVTWGRVTTWEPPNRVAVSWHPGLDPTEATEVEVTFAPAASGTRVELTHNGWESRGGLAAEKRSQYESGWVAVMERFRDEAARSSAGSAL